MDSRLSVRSSLHPTFTLPYPYADHSIQNDAHGEKQLHSPPLMPCHNQLQ